MCKIEYLSYEHMIGSTQHPGAAAVCISHTWSHGMESICVACFQACSHQFLASTFGAVTSTFLPFVRHNDFLSFCWPVPTLPLSTFLLVESELQCTYICDIAEKNPQKHLKVTIISVLAENPQLPTVAVDRYIIICSILTAKIHIANNLLVEIDISTSNLETQ